MKTQHQPVGPAVGLPMVADTAGERADVAGVVVIVVHEAHFRQRANPLRPGTDRINDAAGGRARILWVQRQHQNAGDALRLEFVEHCADARVAVAHRKTHQHVVATLAQVAAQHLGLFVGPDQQGRTFGSPDACVLACRLGGPQAKNDAVQDRPPDHARNLDHARVTEELAQVASQCGGRGCIGRAQVAQQHGGARLAAVGEGGFRGERHGVPVMPPAGWASEAELIGQASAFSDGRGNDHGLQWWSSNSLARCGWVSPNFSTSNRTVGLSESTGGVPSPTWPLPCKVQVPRRRLMISGSLSKRT